MYDVPKEAMKGKRNPNTSKKTGKMIISLEQSAVLSNKKAPVPCTGSIVAGTGVSFIFIMRWTLFSQGCLRPFIRPFGMDLRGFTCRYVKPIFQRSQHLYGFADLYGDTWRYENRLEYADS